MTVTTMKTITKQIAISTLKSVCRIDHAAEIMAPHGPPAAVPAAISETAFPVFKPALAVDAAAFAVASAPFAAACFALLFPISLIAFAVCLAT